ncbi:MAG: S-layer homology domain-containing protein, partial [Oscillospiraceae bacterium]|nr:S-layer homology domain-containing protein [Oscillospiraceae bacterium]
MKRVIARKFLSLALALVTLASFALPAAQAAESDIGGHWAESTLTEWISLGLLSGYTDGTYRPGGSITRAEFAKLVNGLKNYTDAAGDVS